MMWNRRRSLVDERYELLEVTTLQEGIRCGGLKIV